jgi:hypothetical protein
MRIRTFAVLVLVAGFLPACVTYVPVEEWTIARAALEGARDADAPRFVPAIWFKAEQSYREAQRFFKERQYGEARNLFIVARQGFEQAENAARLSRYQSGEAAP